MGKCAADDVPRHVHSGAGRGGRVSKCTVTAAATAAIAIVTSFFTSTAIAATTLLAASHAALATSIPTLLADSPLRHLASAQPASEHQHVC